MNNSFNNKLNIAVAESQNLLNTFGTSLEASVLLPSIFGEAVDTEGVISWLQNSNNSLPEIQIKLASQINYANGAYSADTNTIYIAEEFLLAQKNNISAISQVIIEELGHFLDRQFNVTDAPGDEGELFVAHVLGVELSPEAITAIQTEDDSALIRLDEQLITIEQANFGDNPAFDLIGLTQLRNDPQFAGIDGSGLAVAVIDTGIEYNNNLLAPNYITGFDFVNNDTDPRDDQGHGTHVAGTVGAADETIGVAPDVNIIGLKVLDENGNGNSFNINQALQWVLDNHEEYDIVAVNMSLGGGFYTSENELLGDPGIDLVNRLEREGVTVVSAAGNAYQYKDRSNSIPNEQQNVGAPAIYSTLSVGAVWQDERDPFGYYLGSQNPGADRVTVFSQRLNADNFILAPGALINSTYPDADGFELLPGTSMAAPHVAGAVALLQEAALEFGGRLLTPDEVVDILRSTGDIVIDGDDESDIVVNTGLSFPRLSIYNAVVELKRRFDGIAPPPPDDDPGNDLSGDPNGTIAGATEVILGNDLQPLLFPGFIGADYGEPVGVSDVDLYRIVVPDDGILFVDIDTPFAEGEYIDSFLRLFDEEGNELFFTSNGEPFESNDDLAFDARGNFTEFSPDSTSEIVVEDPNQTNLINGVFDDEGNYTKGNYGHRTDSFLGVIVERGQVYHIGVSDFDNQNYDPKNLDNRLETGEGGFYELIASFVNSDINGTITQVTTTSPLPIISLQENIGEDEGVEVGDRDVDFYKFNSEQVGLLEIDIDSTEVDAFALLFDRNGNLIAENDDTDGLDPLLQYEIEANTDYYVAITGYGNQNFDPFGSGSGAGGDTGEYTLNARLLASSTVDLLANDTIDSESVLTINLGDRLKSEIGQDNGLVLGADDIDLYRFIAPNDGTVNIRASADEAFSADTFLRLFDRNGNEIAFNDDESPQTRGSFIQQEVTANTEYIIGVNGSSDRAREYDPVTGNGAAPGDQGNYTLSITDSNGNNPGDSDTIDLYRFRNTSFSTGTYVFVGALERDAILNNPDLNQTFELEGGGNPAFKANTKEQEGNIPFYRLRSIAVPGTFLFVSTAEYEAIFALGSRQRNQWVQEGLDSFGNDIAEFYLLPPGSGNGSLFNRYQNRENGTFLYAGPQETIAIDSNPDFSNAFMKQGGAFESLL